MRKLALIICGILSCIGYTACDSGPINGSCPQKDFNNECCITQSDCTQYSGNPEQEAKDIVDGCLALDSKRQPLLCLESFNTDQIRNNCVPLTVVVEDGGQEQRKEFCMGGNSAWDGRQPYSYEIWCCK